MKTTFSYFPGMFENPAPVKIIFQKVSIQIRKDATFNSDRKQINSKQIIQILQTVVIDYFSTH